MAIDPRCREAARAALATYREQDGHKATDEQESIGDLIADLAHLADLLATEEAAEEAEEYLDGGETLLDRASRHYYAERDGAE